MTYLKPSASQGGSWSGGAASVLALATLILYALAGNGIAPDGTASWLRSASPEFSPYRTDESHTPAQTHAQTVPTPSGRGFHDMAYDASSDRTILFGGFEDSTGNNLQDTWAYDLATNRWTEMSPSIAPSPRVSPSMAYDVHVDRVLLFGGARELGGGTTPIPFNDTWAYDFDMDAWEKLDPSATPAARQGHRMAHDVESNRTILFAGHALFAIDPKFRDTWTYHGSNNTWTNLTPSASPAARTHFGMAYDIESDRVVLFGGLSDTGNSDETWTYDYNTNTWTNKDPTPRPLSTTGPPAVAYDAESDRFIAFFGGETWAYHENLNVWTEMAPDPSPGNINARMTYDSMADRVVLFGGRAETWTYDFNANTWKVMTPPGPPQNLQAVGGDGVVNLTWELPLRDYNAPILAYRVYRGTAAGGPPFLVEIGTNPSYTDSDVMNGVGYYYQVTAINTGGEGPHSAEVSALPDEPPDTVDPTITIDPRSDYGIGEVTITGTASDNVAVVLVEISEDLNMATWRGAVGTTNWSATVTLALGSNHVTARATDSSGNTATAGFVIHFDGPLGGGLLIVGITIGGAAAVGAALFLLYRRRRRGGDAS